MLRHNQQLVCVGERIRPVCAQQLAQASAVASISHAAGSLRGGSFAFGRAVASTSISAPTLHGPALQQGRLPLATK